MKFIKQLFLLLAIAGTLHSKAQGERTCGSEFAAYGLEGATFSQAIDFVGRTHNDYQVYLLEHLSNVRPDFTDTTALKEIIFQNLKNFLAA